MATFIVIVDAVVVVVILLFLWIGVVVIIIVLKESARQAQTAQLGTHISSQLSQTNFFFGSSLNCL